MRIYKPKGTYKKYYIELRDHIGKVRRFAACSDRKMSRLFGNQLQRLISFKLANEPPDGNLTHWLENVPVKLRTHLAQIGLLDANRAAAGKPLAEHLADFRRSIGDTTKHACCSHNALLRLFKDCSFVYWSDIEPVRLDNYLREKFLPESQRTFNFYLKAAQQFCRWMVRNRLAVETPIPHLQTVVVTDPKVVRRTLSEDKLVELLEVTANAPKRCGMTGLERAWLYRLAAETGLRRGQLASLKVSSFDFENCTVTAKASYSKNLKENTLPLLRETAMELRCFLSDKLSEVKAFNVPEKTGKMLQKDLEAIGVPYIDEAGERFDFHAIRHTFCTILGKNPEVAGRVAQKFMQHQSSAMTDRYTHIRLLDVRKALVALPNLSIPSKKQQRKVS